MAYLQKLLAENVKEARLHLKFSQVYLATLCGLSVSSIREIERGRRFPSPLNIERLGNALGLRPYKLFYDKEQLEVYTKHERLSLFYRELADTIDTVLDEITNKYLKSSGVI